MSYIHQSSYLGRSGLVAASETADKAAKPTKSPKKATVAPTPDSKTLAKREAIMQLINNDHKGQIFTVTFTKKDGSERVMNCRRGVTKHLAGGESTIAHCSNLLSVYDMQEADYRCFNMDTTKSVRVGGKTINFDI